ncbi:hypothetical protein CAMSH0001_1662 [Campylobacter showae RM3277]|uniref:Uncharacterized protein n=1 Tax=Campylobacter showae RM3277 TaxID=553219 RepID=C6RES9_9BACT|nr:hypothetical protein CAMSH0001_1662 [Campylobacter showae RM3277]
MAGRTITPNLTRFVCVKFDSDLNSTRLGFKFYQIYPASFIAKISLNLTLDFGFGIKI